MLYDIEVRPTPKSGHFRYYIETVEAPTMQDAVMRVQRRNPDCKIRCCKSYNDNSSSSSSSDFEDVTGWLILGSILFCIWVLVEYWWIVVPIAAIVLLSIILAKWGDR